MSKLNFKMQNKGKGQGCLILFGIPFAGAGCFMLWTLVISPIMEASGRGTNMEKEPYLC